MKGTEKGNEQLWRKPTSSGNKPRKVLPPEELTQELERAGGKAEAQISEPNVEKVEKEIESKRTKGNQKGRNCLLLNGLSTWRILLS